MNDDFNFSDFDFNELNKKIDASSGKAGGESPVTPNPADDLDLGFDLQRELDITRAQARKTDADIDLGFDLQSQLGNSAGGNDSHQNAVAASAAAALSGGTDIPSGYEKNTDTAQFYSPSGVFDPSHQYAQPAAPDTQDDGLSLPDVFTHAPAASQQPARGITGDGFDDIPITDIAAGYEEPAPVKADYTASIKQEDLSSDEFMDTIKVDLNELKKQKTELPPKRLGWLWGVLKGLGYAFSFAMGCALVGIIVFFAMINGYSDPSMDELFANRTLDYTTTLYYQDTDTGEYKQLQELYYAENRTWVNLEDIPKHTQEALIAIEDERFYQHNGVDWKRFGGAVIGWVTGNSTYGGSTITQQLIKNLTGENQQTWQRKALEVLRALYVERKYSKNEILEYYLNTVYFNYRAYGIGKAAELYFNKPATELTAAESAAIVSIVKAPSAYEPYNHPDNNNSRKEIVLGKMLQLGFLDQAEYDEAIAQHLSFNPDGQQMALDTTNSYFVDALIEDVISDLQENFDYSYKAAEQYLFSSGLKIYTTVNMKAQTALEEAYSNTEFFPAANTDYIYQSACMLMDYHNGHVLAVVGGRGEKTENRGLNRATMSRRQPGSSIKPLSVYLPALDAGVITEGTVIDDMPVTVLGGEAYPQNFARQYYGRTTMFYAIEQSLNATPAQILIKLGYRASFDFLSKKLHFDGLVDSATDGEGDVNLAALSMGAFNYGVYLRDMVAGYGAIGAGGVYHKPITYTKIESNDGKTIIEKLDEGEQICSVQSAWLMQDLLVDGVNNGIAKPGKLSIPLAAKTGTSNYNYDKWFMGYTPYFSAGVWCGYDEPENLASAGVTTAVPKIIWKNVLQYVVDQVGWEGGELLAKPDNIVQGSFCEDCGLLPSANCLLDVRGSRVKTAWYVEGTQPSETCTCHVPVYICDASGMIAHDGCPSATLKSMVNAEREFSVDFKIADGEFIYRPVPEGTPLALSGVVFANLLPAGSFSGTPTTDGHHNWLCTAHGRTAYPTLYNPNVVVEPDSFDITMPEAGTGYRVSPSAGSVITVSGGNRFIFSVTISRGYNAPDVTANGEKLVPNSINGRIYTYLIDEVKADTLLAISLTVATETNFTVSLPTGEGYIISPAETSVVVESGSSYSFAVTLQNGYTKLAVMVNGMELVASSVSESTHYFTIPALSGNVTVTVTATP